MNELKKFYIDRAISHYEAAVIHYDANEILQECCWQKENETFRGCVIGCLVNADRNEYEELKNQTNIPVWLSNLADTIHEGLGGENSKLWLVKFIIAVPEQIFTKEWSALDIDKKIKSPFLILVLKSALETFCHAKHADVKDAINGSIALWQRYDIDSDEWKKAAAEAASEAEAASKKAGAAAWAADAAARAAAEAAAMEAWNAARTTDAATRELAWEAEAAAEAAEREARAAEREAWAAASAARVAAASSAWEAAREAAREGRYEYFFDQLILIMEKAGRSDSILKSQRLFQEACPNFTLDRYLEEKNAEANAENETKQGEMTIMSNKMKIEAGKFYKTRDGRKVFVKSIDHGDKNYPVKGMIYLEIQDSWTEKGGSLINYKKSSDIIAPWEDEMSCDLGEPKPVLSDRAIFRQYACAALTGLLAGNYKDLLIDNDTEEYEFIETNLSIDKRIEFAVYVAKQMMEEEGKL